MSISKQAIDAALDAGLETHDWEMFEPQQGDLGDAVGVAITAALEAAMPHIREQIAEEINNIEEPPDDRECRYIDGWSDAVSYAAYIARGEP